MRVLLTGSRDWTKRGPIEALMLGMKGAFFILGDNPNGLDALALKVCREYNLPHIVLVAEWNSHLGCRCLNKERTCKFAGHRRNGDMVAQKPDVAFAFRNNGISRGTDNCVKQCLASGVPTYTIRQEDPHPNPLEKGYKYNSKHDPSFMEDDNVE